MSQLCKLQRFRSCFCSLHLMARSHSVGPQEVQIIQRLLLGPYDFHLFRLLKSPSTQMWMLKAKCVVD